MVNQNFQINNAWNECFSFVTHVKVPGRPGMLMSKSGK